MNLVDEQARRTISKALDQTLFVEAGAGSGKTSSLVERIVNLVDVDGISVNKIAAITFTEAAARELRTRVRDALEQRSVDAQIPALEAAAGQVESAAFTTLHSFALRMLADYPIEAGLPPGFGVVDEITSTLEFDESWRIFIGQVGDDMSLFDLQERAAAMRIDFRHFAEVARRFDDNWDLLDRLKDQPWPGSDPDDETGQPRLSEINFVDLLADIDRLASMADLCAVPEDLYLIAFESFIEQVRQIATMDPLDQVQALLSLRLPPRNRGRGSSWRGTGLAGVRKEVDEFQARIEERIDTYRNQVMQHFILLVAEFVASRVAKRQASGELAFHDLLVLARRLLRTDEVVRRTLHQRYSRILLDEFQDTDPIQIELAVLLASSDPVGTSPWQILAERLEPGRLVVVGDPKQSIYRFRRADMAVYSETDEVLGGQRCQLTTNFRSVPGILAWVNHVFTAAIGMGEPGKQPPYVALSSARPEGPNEQIPVTVLGGPHPSATKVRQIREIEGLEVAASVCRIMEEGWPVQRDDQWLPARLKDIAVLIPSRLSLPSLESAFAATNVPFRPETNSLVYATQEVRDVLAGVRAVVDPSNSVDVVATLRSALFAIGDDELLAWKLAEGSWDYRILDIPQDDAKGWPVAEAFAVLRAWHEDRWWMEPASLIDRIVRERRLRESALAEPRPRDRWRRYRFLAEQAREFAETQGGDLHDFVDWVEIQSSDMARVTEPIPAEPDDDAVRVLTIHGAKGLEFPVVILAGAPTAEGRGRIGPQVIFPQEGRPEVTLGSDRRTTDYDIHASMEEVLDSYERVRLHYVAATRARDHLIVSAHHKEGRAQSIGRRTWEAVQGCPELWQGFERRGDEHYAVEPPTQLRLSGGGYQGELSEWTRGRRQIIEAAEGAGHRSASGLAEAERLEGRESEQKAEPTIERSEQPVLPSLGEPEVLADELWRSEGSGSALGSAVHAVLEVVDFSAAGDLGPPCSSAAARFGIGHLAAEVERRVRVALDSPSIALARTNKHHRELYVAMPAGRGSVEGFVDLCIETEDGLIVVDYKTDAIGSTAEDRSSAIEDKVDGYRLQGATYAVALEHITGMPVVECRFVFIGPDKATEVVLPELESACSEVRQKLALPASH